MSDKHPNENWKQQIQSIQENLDMNPEGFSIRMTEIWGDVITEMIEHESTGKEMAATLLNAIEKDIAYHQGHADRLRSFRELILFGYVDQGLDS